MRDAVARRQRLLAFHGRREVHEQQPWANRTAAGGSRGTLALTGEGGERRRCARVAER